MSEEKVAAIDKHITERLELFHSHWLVCAPRHYGVTYEINPWMDVAKTPDQAMASRQWHILHHTLLRLGAWLEYVDQESGLPDMVFTANGGLVVGDKVVLPHFRPQERQGETPLFREWFERNGYTTFESSSYTFEGEGDALFLGSTLIGGYGFRSEKDAYPEISEFLSLPAVETVELVDPRFYHLDTCFCPLDNTTALIVPSAVSPASLKVLESLCDLIAVPEDEALKFACNSVVIGKNVVMPAGAPKTGAELEKRGFSVWPVELDQFLRAGGAAKCLTLRIDRDAL